MFEHFSFLQFGAKWVKANQTDEPRKRLRVFATEPANCINEKGTTEGLSVTLSPATLRTQNNRRQRHKRPCLPLSVEARAPYKSYLIGQQRAQSKMATAPKSRTFPIKNRVVTTNLQTSRANQTRLIRPALMIFVPAPG